MGLLATLGVVFLKLVNLFEQALFNVGKAHRRVLPFVQWIGENRVLGRYMQLQFKRTRIRSMQFRNKNLVLAICLFLIAFKVAVGSVFIQSAIERVQFQNHSFSVSTQHTNEAHQSADDKQPVHTMHLMNHVTASMHEIGIHVTSPLLGLVRFSSLDESLLNQNVPDCAFKPPKAKA